MNKKDIRWLLAAIPAVILIAAIVFILVNTAGRRQTPTVKPTAPSGVETLAPAPSAPGTSAPGNTGVVFNPGTLPFASAEHLPTMNETWWMIPYIDYTIPTYDASALTEAPTPPARPPKIRPPRPREPRALPRQRLPPAAAALRLLRQEILRPPPPAPRREPRRLLLVAPPQRLRNRPLPPLRKPGNSKNPHAKREALPKEAASPFLCFFCRKLSVRTPRPERTCSAPTRCRRRRSHNNSLNAAYGPGRSRSCPAKGRKRQGSCAFFRC